MHSSGDSLLHQESFHSSYSSFEEGGRKTGKEMTESYSHDTLETRLHSEEDAGSTNIPITLFL